MTTVQPASIAVKHTQFSSKLAVWKNKISSSSFDCNETRVVFIGEYVSTIISVHPTSIAIKKTCLFTAFFLVVSSLRTGLNFINQASISIQVTSFRSIQQIEHFHHGP